MNTQIPRFEIIDQSSGNVVAKKHTTDSIYRVLKTLDLGLNSYLVVCLIDDIEISADEFMEAFDSGECPGDLQFF